VEPPALNGTQPGYDSAQCDFLAFYQLMLLPVTVGMLVVVTLAFWRRAVSASP